MLCPLRLNRWLWGRRSKAINVRASFSQLVQYFDKYDFVQQVANGVITKKARSTRAFDYQGDQWMD